MSQVQSPPCSGGYNVHTLEETPGQETEVLSLIHNWKDIDRGGIQHPPKPKYLRAPRGHLIPDLLGDTELRGVQTFVVNLS